MKKRILFLVLLLSILFINYNVYAQEGWVEENGKTYYYENSEIVKGFKTIDDKLYFFSRITGELKKGWQETTEGKWYQNTNGEVLKGPQTIEENKYYFNENGMMQKGFITIDEKLYFFSKVTGILKTGWQETTEGKWYQNTNGEVLKNLQTLDGKKYYFNENGMMQKGFVTINEVLYFFSKVTGELKTGWQETTEGKWYQNTNGEVLKGLQTIGSNTYYFSENGFAQKGFVTIDGKKYFFSGINYVLKKGWQSTATDVNWYQDENGALVTGNQTIDGRDYKFNEETGMLEGFKKENNKLYYYNPDGTLNKGVQYMTEQFWKFDANTGAFEKIVRQIRVIDISTHNGVIDWNRVKASNQVDGVILRLGYGQNYLDSRFLYNKSELERLGIPYSVYLFSYAENKTEAQKEADFVVRTIQNEAVKVASSIFSVYYDLEDWEIRSTGENSYGISQDTYGQMITTFVNTIESKLGVKGRVYASKNYIETRFPVYARDYATWVAQWNDTITYKGNYEGWQYSSTGSVPGINGNVDMNIFYY